MRNSPRAIAVFVVLSCVATLIIYDRKGVQSASPIPLAPFLSRIAAAPIVTPLTPKSPLHDATRLTIERETSSGELYDTLFSKSFGSQKKIPADWIAAAQERFRQPYPAQRPEAELTARLGILKAFGKAEATKPAISFFRHIATSPGEHWLLQRQALRNLRPWLSHATEKDRFTLFGNANPAALSLASLSEQELLGGLWSDLGSKRAPAESAEMLSKNKYENLPCPSAEEFASLSGKVRWLHPEPYICDSSRQGKLGRLLLFVSRIDFGPPEEGSSGHIERELRYPMEFLERNTLSLGVELLQSTTVARNEGASGNVLLGSSFFEMDPLEAAHVLVHEARHSNPQVAGHFTCKYGDLPGAMGACDTELSDGELAGAYSYSVYFYLKLAKLSQLSPADREYATSEALSMIIRRFNRLPPHLGQFTDGLLGLAENGSVHFFHPFARYSFPLGEGKEPGDAVHGMAYDNFTGGALLFQNKGQARRWSWDTEETEFFPELLQEARLKLKFAGKLVLPNDPTSFTYTTLLSLENRLHYLRVNEESGKREVVDYPLQPANFVVRQFCQSSAQFPYNYNFFLSQEGKIFRSYAWSQEKDFNLVHWDGGQNWQQIDCGVLHDTLYSVSASGQIHRQGWIPDDSIVGEDVTFYKPESTVSDFQSEAGAKAYREGTQMRAILNGEGEIELRYYADSQARPVVAFGQGKLTDLSFVKLTSTRGTYRMPRKSKKLSRFSGACSIPQPQHDPWMHHGMGVDRSGRLIVEGRKGECIPAAIPEEWQGKVRSFEFISGEFAESDPTFSLAKPAERHAFFAPLSLYVELKDGSKHQVRPYQGWRAVEESGK